MEPEECIGIINTLGVNGDRNRFAAQILKSKSSVTNKAVRK